MTHDIYGNCEVLSFFLAKATKNKECEPSDKTCCRISSDNVHPFAQENSHTDLMEIFSDVK